jgi:hypothetical protein
MDHRIHHVLYCLNQNRIQCCMVEMDPDDIYQAMDLASVGEEIQTSTLALYE